MEVYGTAERWNLHVARLRIHFGVYQADKFIEFVNWAAYKWVVILGFKH